VEPDHISSVAEALSRYPWHRQANCRDYPSPDHFHLEGRATDADPRPQSKLALRTLELCVSCPVRLPCLVEGLTLVSLSLGPNGPRITGGLPQGLWGGAFTTERRRVRKLPVAEAVQVLEDGLQARLAARRLAVSRPRRNARLVRL